MFNLPKKQYVDSDGSLKEKEVGKILLMEEAWSALKSENMANYIGYLYRTARKHYAQICIVTQEPSDLVGNKNIEDIVSTQSPVKILLDFAQYKDMQDKITRSLGLTKDEIAKLMSVNQNLQFKGRNKYKEAFIKVGERSAVYATEVSKEEALAYSTEKKIKSDLMSLKRTFQLTMAQAIEKKLYNKLPYEEN
jgi:type IV secretory pathway VirB4 component